MKNEGKAPVTSSRFDEGAKETPKTGRANEGRLESAIPEFDQILTSPL